MGEIVSVHCDCGYSREPLCVGWGMEYERGGRELFQCLDCHHILISKTQTIRKTCSKCRGHSLHEINLSDKQPLICPACERTAMYIGICGVWD